MAIVKYSAIVAEARGKEGGVVFSRNASGAYIKTKVTPTNPRTAAQQEQRGLFGSIAQAWKGLTATERTQWQVFADQVPQTNVFGDQIILSGFNAFVRSARNLSVIGSAFLSTPGPVPSFPSLSQVILTSNSSEINLSFVINGDASGCGTIIDCTPGVGTGKSFVNNLFRKVQGEDRTPESPIDLTGFYIVRFGALPVTGQKVFSRIRLVDKLSGWDTSYYSTHTIATAL